MFFGSVQIIRQLDNQSKFSGRDIGGLRRSTNMAGGSIILRGTFRRISQLWDNAHSLNLEKFLLYSLSIISQSLLRNNAHTTRSRSSRARFFDLRH